MREEFRKGAKTLVLRLFVQMSERQFTEAGRTKPAAFDRVFKSKESNKLEALLLRRKLFCSEGS